MITADEINQKSQDLGVGVANVERDYVCGWLLTGIYSATALRDVLILKGGCCLRKAYFEHTRFTKDLDFSTQSAVDAGFLRTELNRACEFVQESAGVTFRTDETRVEPKRQIDQEKMVYEARLYFQDFSGNADHIVISIRLDVT